LKEQHGKQTKKITELIDLYPTLADLAGLKAPDNLHGTSLQPLLKDPEADSWSKEMAFTISRSGGESIKTNKYRYTHWGFGSAGEELYDLEKDPLEQNNLIEKTPELRKLLSNLLDAHIQRDLPDGLIGTSHVKIDDESLKMLKSLGYIQ